MPVDERTMPDGLIAANGDYYYAENPPGTGVQYAGRGGQSGAGRAGAGSGEERVVLTKSQNELF